MVDDVRMGFDASRPLRELVDAAHGCLLWQTHQFPQQVVLFPLLGARSETKRYFGVAPFKMHSLSPINYRVTVNIIEEVTLSPRQHPHSMCVALYLGLVSCCDRE